MVRTLIIGGVSTAVLTLSAAVFAQQGQLGTAEEAKPEGQITEVSYLAPKPGTTAPAVPKVTFVTRVNDLVCAVGYYK